MSPPSASLPALSQAVLPLDQCGLADLIQGLAPTTCQALSFTQSFLLNSHNIPKKGVLGFGLLYKWGN